MKRRKPFFCKTACRGSIAAGVLTACLALPAGNVWAQLSSNPDKFLGNITTSYNVDFGNEKYYTLWNQITPENESKWDAIEGSRRGQFNFGGADNAYNYAKNHGFPFKFHCLIWGAQYPGWLNNLSTSEQYKAIEEWMDAIKKQYPELPMIDVVNEAVAGHQPAPYKAALGGDGKTGYDWIIKAFEMAHERWPDAILIYNDYNTFQWQRQQFIDLVRTLRDAGAPIDAYGCQSHDLTDMNFNDFKAAMTEIQTALRIPMYSTEYDIGTSDDALQKQRYSEQIPYMWESDYVAGVTLWGYIYGRTWTTDGNSGLIRDGKDRPAMTWLRQYMKSDAAKNAKSPFPGMVKEASVYVKPAALSVTKGDKVPVQVRARLKTKTIERVELYVKNELVGTKSSEPYAFEYVPEVLGRYDLKAVVVATDGSRYERLSGFTAYNPRSPFKGAIELPGTIEAENFDGGAEGLSFHDSDSKNEGGTSYRTDGGGVDIVSGNGGYAIGYTASGEWLEYTVDVKEAGIYSYDAYVSSGATNSSFSLTLNDDRGLTPLTGVVNVPCVQANNWDNYRAVHGRLNMPLQAGKQIIRLNITGSSCNIDRILMRRVDLDEDMQIALTTDPASATVGKSALLKAEVAPGKGSEVTNVKFYVNNVLQKNVGTAPFEVAWTPAEKGTYDVMAIAIDNEGRHSKVAEYSLKVNNQRTPYRKVDVPGFIEAENFDRGGEGFTFHDADSKDEGGTNYRTDGEGVDIVSGNGSHALGYTAVDDWTEYTFNVTQAGRYTFEAVVSSGTTGSGFSIAIVRDGEPQTVCRMTVPQTGNGSWDTYTTVKSAFGTTLEEGEATMRVTITGANCNIDKIRLICSEPTGIEEIPVADASDANNACRGKAVNLLGQPVDDDYKGVVIVDGKRIIRR